MTTFNLIAHPGRLWHRHDRRCGMNTFDLIAHLHRQIDFSARTFGPGDRRSGIADHIAKELLEVAREPVGSALPEWIDVILLAFDGAWRDGHSAEDIAAALAEKLTRNEGRSWPDWRTQDPSKAIEHIKHTSHETP